jgi:hypothetical protein
MVEAGFFALPQRIGCPILRAFREGWDRQKLRGRASGESSGIPPFAESAKDGAPDSLWQGKKDPPYGRMFFRQSE